MSTLTLPWYPPAPAAGPTSILQLPSEEWALEPKIDGIRVIWLNGRPFTRHGGLLTSSKGADRLTQILAKISHTLDGEWVPALDTFFAFDLPDYPLDYDGRRATLAMMLDVGTASDSLLAGNTVAMSHGTTNARLRLMTSYTRHFPQIYAGLKGQGAEGVVIKRRRTFYPNQLWRGVESRDWFKRRFEWD